MSDKKEGLFRPECKVSEDGNEITCDSEFEVDGKTFKPRRPIRIRMLGQGESARLQVLDDGGAPDFVLRKLEESIRQQRID